MTDIISNMTNSEMPPVGGENTQESLEMEKSRLTEFLKGGVYGFTEEEVNSLIDSNKSEEERKHFIEIIKGKGVSEFEANLLIDLCWNNLEDRKWIEKEDVIRLAIERAGFTDDVRQLVCNWQTEQEIIITKHGSDLGGFDLNLDRADIYAAAGMIDEAFDCLDDALLQVENRTDNSKDVMKEKVMKKWDALLVIRRAGK